MATNHFFVRTPPWGALLPSPTTKHECTAFGFWVTGEGFDSFEVMMHRVVPAFTRAWGLVAGHRLWALPALPHTASASVPVSTRLILDSSVVRNCFRDAWCTQTQPPSQWRTTPFWSCTTPTEAATITATPAPKRACGQRRQGFRQGHPRGTPLQRRGGFGALVQAVCST
jgi:hypothetical protein